MSSKISITQLRNLTLAVLLLALGGVVGYRYGQSQTNAADQPWYKVINIETPKEYEDVEFDQFWSVWKVLERDYLEPSKLDQKKMVDGAISGMTAALGDPYTVYLPPVQQQRSKEDLQGSFFGVGIQLGYVDDTLAVIAPVKGTPAEKAGIMAGDLILRVKDPSKNFDQETTGWSLAEAVDHIRGEKGTKIQLTLYRLPEKKDGEGKQFEVEVERGEVIVPSVELVFVENNGQRAAHLMISRFGERTVSELNTAVNDILKERPNIKGIVLDLRNNPGGFFDGAIEVAGEFMKNDVVVTQQGKFSKEDYRAKGQGRLINVPLIILVNKGSASASEILAGALRDQRDVKLVGEKTFGKGTVQDARELGNGAGLHVTVARWLLPDGAWIHEEGIPVAVEVKDDPETKDIDEALNKAIELL
jgi:carboxyl-terminal processing protease